MKTQAEVRTRHDEWGKRALSLWLKALGDVTIDARVAGESRRGDVLYTERRERRAHRRKLGALGDLARGQVLFELFRNPPTVLELRSCVLKAIDLAAQEARAARRAKGHLSSVKGPMLCVIVPSLSRDFAKEAGARPMAGGPPGLFTLAPMLRTVLVVVNKLPVDDATLWLRLLGRGKVQVQAAEQLLNDEQARPAAGCYPASADRLAADLAAAWERE